MILNGIRAILACAVLSLLVSTPVAAQQSQQPPPASQTSTVNLNTATVEQLTELPGIGPKTAQLIVEYRTKNGGFKKVEELMNIKGIGEKSFLKIKPLVSAPAKAEKGAGD